MTRGGGGSRSILVTGSSPSEGKTTTGINLAAALAATGRSVILIEADLRRPSVGRALAMSAKRGVVSVLIESVKLEDALVQSEQFGPNLQAPARRLRGRLDQRALRPARPRCG